MILHLRCFCGAKRWEKGKSEIAVYPYGDPEEMKCIECGRIVHLEMKDIGVSHQCKICKKEYKSKSGLTKHMRVHNAAIRL